MPNSQVNSQSQHLHSVGTSDSSGRKKTVLEGHGYVMGNTIGTGTYATVKVAWSTAHNANVAIKIVSKFTAPTDYLKKFLPREIDVVKGLKHPNLIRFLQAIETTHRVYIIMEYADNGSLLDIIRQDTHIDEPRARVWFKQLIEAITYCHERNVVHSTKDPSTYWFRDIKCENMLMDTNFNLKLSDFGFARSQLKTSSGQYVLSETFCGSYAYASPEILKGIPYQPHYADVWSCGVVLYAMVFGRLPFDDSNFATLLKQVSSKVTFPREPKVSSQCKNLINKILAPLKQRITLSSMVHEPWWMISSDEAKELPMATTSAVKSVAEVKRSKYVEKDKSKEKEPVQDITENNSKTEETPQ